MCPYLQNNIENVWAAESVRRFQNEFKGIQIKEKNDPFCHDFFNSLFYSWMGSFASLGNQCFYCQIWGTFLVGQFSVDQVANNKCTQIPNVPYSCDLYPKNRQLFLQWLKRGLRWAKPIIDTVCKQ